MLSQLLVNCDMISHPALLMVIFTGVKISLLFYEAATPDASRCLDYCGSWNFFATFSAAWVAASTAFIMLVLTAPFSSS